MLPSWNYLVQPADLPPTEPKRHTLRQRLDDYIGAHVSDEYGLRKSGPNRWLISVFSQQDAAVIRTIFPSALEFNPGLVDGSLLMLRFAYELREMAIAGITA